MCFCQSILPTKTIILVSTYSVLIINTVQQDTIKLGQDHIQAMQENIIEQPFHGRKNALEIYINKVIPYGSIQGVPESTSD